MGLNARPSETSRELGTYLFIVELLYFALNTDFRLGVTKFDAVLVKDDVIVKWQFYLTPICRRTAPLSLTRCDTFHPTFRIHEGKQRSLLQ